MSGAGQVKAKRRNQAIERRHVTGRVTGTIRTTPEQRALKHRGHRVQAWSQAGLLRLVPLGLAVRQHEENEDKGLDED